MWYYSKIMWLQLITGYKTASQITMYNMRYYTLGGTNASSKQMNSFFLFSPTSNVQITLASPQTCNAHVAKNLSE